MRVSGLPFPFDVQGDPRSGASATVAVDMAAPANEEPIDQLRCVVAWFAQLGEFGALAGTALRPGTSRAALPGGEPQRAGTHFEWHFDALAVDSAAMTVLANLIFATGLPVHRAELTTQGPTDRRVLAADEYPGRPVALGFSLDERRLDRNVDLGIEFGSDVPQSLEDPITDILRVWCLVASLGGWRTPGPVRPALDLIPEDDPEITLDELNLSFQDNHLHDAAYDGLLALICAFPRHGLPVSRVTMH
jgi:hypothetical protein